MAVHSGDRLNRADRRTVRLSYRPFAFPLSSEEDARTKDKDIDQNQDNAQTEQNPVRFFRKMEQEQIQELDLKLLGGNDEGRAERKARKSD